MVLPAAERTAEIPATRVAGMREETHPAVAAAHRAVPQLRTVPQDGVQGELILTNERPGAVVLMPILAKNKKFRDGYGKIARFSVTMLIVFGISSSYSLDAIASRGRARISCVLQKKTGEANPYKRPATQSPPDQAAAASRFHSSVYPTSNSYLEKRKSSPLHSNSSFQVVGQLIRAEVGQIS
jgi:hypothetical protein